MKRRTEVILRRGGLFTDYHALDGSLALCPEWVDCRLDGKPNRIKVQVRATAKAGFITARRSECGGQIRVGRSNSFAYEFVHETLRDIGVKPGDKFWFKLTAAK